MRYTTVLSTSLWLACGLAAMAGACAPAGFANAQPQSPPAAQAQTPPASNPPSGEGPTEVVQGAAQGMLGHLNNEGDAYHRDPATVGQLVDEHLLAHVHTEAAPRPELGV